MSPAYRCECEGPHALYRVTDHAGKVSACLYCAACAALAGVDWNGETAKCEAVDSACVSDAVCDALGVEVES